MDKRIDSLDYCKFLMAIFVVAIHTFPLENSERNFLLRTAVPFFFTISGYFYFRKWAIQPTLGLGSYLKKIIHLYLFWTVAYLPLAVYDYYYDNKTMQDNLLSFLKDFIFTGQHFYSWPLWYLLSLIYMLPIAYLCWVKVKNKYIQIMIFTLTILVHFLLYHMSTNFSSYGYCGHLLEKTLFNGRLFSAYIYLSVAYFLSKKRCYSLGGGAVGLIFVLFLNYLLPSMHITTYNIIITMMRIVFVYSLFSICLFFSNKKIKGAFFAKKASSVMYFTHMYFFFFYSLFFRYVGYKGVDAFIVTTLLTLGCSCIVVYFSQKSTFARKYL